MKTKPLKDKALKSEVMIDTLKELRWLFLLYIPLVFVLLASFNWIAGTIVIP